MNEKVLIVEDQFIEANDLRIVLTRNGYTVTDIARSYENAAKSIELVRPDLVLLDIFLKGKLTGIDLAKKLRNENIPFVYLSAYSTSDVLMEAKATEPYGFLVKPFREQEVLATLEIARYRHEHSLESRLRNEAALKKLFEDIVRQKESSETKLRQLTTSLQPYIPFDFICYDMGSSQPDPFNRCFVRLGFEEYEGIDLGNYIPEFSKNRLNSIQAIQSGIFNTEALAELAGENSHVKLVVSRFPMASLLSVTLTQEASACHILFFSRKENAYHPDHVNFINRLLDSLKKVFQSTIAGGMREEIQPAAPKAELRNHKPTFHGLIGSSYKLLNVFDSVVQVAPRTTSVLILGESGTGKERIADSIQKLSARKDGPYIKVNCATLPSSLIESELFGHEKGAFTGAVERRIGKFEQANGGTILLDEIGEMPVEFQAKWLRVLQEKEIERIGGNSPIKVDVRVIATTNRDLEKEVSQGKFRLDLYYRLNVFPIQLPALRERADDIPLLVDHFVRSFSLTSGKTVKGVSPEVLRQLVQYTWPGNIRQLEHLLERAIVLANGEWIDHIQLPVAASDSITQALPVNGRIKTMQENERDHIIDVLKRCHGKIWGNGGAAELLDIPPTTLQSRMKKLGVSKSDFWP